MKSQHYHARQVNNGSCQSSASHFICFTGLAPEHPTGIELVQGRLQ